MLHLYSEPQVRKERNMINIEIRGKRNYIIYINTETEFETKYFGFQKYENLENL